MSEYLEAPISGLSLPGAVNCAVADLAEAYLEAHPGMRALHCGAVRLGGRLVLLTGPARAGKSTLMARLSMEPGAGVFCDDVLPIHPDGRAVALGVPPRLRLPLPATVSAAFRAHVDGSGGVADDRYAYVPGPTIVGHGQMATPEVLIVLHRKPGAGARLHHLSADRAVAWMLAQDMSLQSDGIAHIDRVTAMAQSMVCATLVYDDLEAAVQVVQAAFGQAGPLRPDLAAQVEEAAPASAAAAAADLDMVLRRYPDVAVRQAQAGAYLWDMVSGRYFRLNTVALACWTLIETPQTGAELADTIAAFFPDAAPAVVRRDVALLLGQLLQGGLIEAGRAG